MTRAIETGHAGPIIGRSDGHGEAAVAAISSIAYGFMGSQALFAALELGLFTELAEGPARADELAGKLGAHPQPFRALLAACTALHLIEQTGDHYRNTPAADRFLVRHARGYMGHYYLQQIAGTLYSELPIARTVVRGQSQATTYAHFLDDPARTEAFIRGQHAGSSGPASLLAKSLDLSPFTRLLDLGGGSGSFAIEAVRRYPSLGAVVVDHPGVIAVAEKIVAEAHLQHRIEFATGNVVADTWPAGADLILLSYVVSSYQPETLRNLLARAHAYLPPSGGLIIHDFALHGDRPGPRNSALWLFANLAISATTHPYTVTEMVQMMAECGFVEIESRPHIPDITFVFVARRR